MKRRIAVAFILTLITLAAHADYRISVWVRTKTASVSAFNTYNQGTVNEANPVWYYFTTTTGPNGPVVNIVDVHTSSHEITLSGAAKVPTIQNTQSGQGFADSSTLMGYIFRSDADMNDHAQKVANLVTQNGYDGIDLDYERMLVNVADADIPAWRDKFTSLVRKIKALLPNKIVSVTVYRRRSYSGSRDSRNAQAYDYRALTDTGAADYMKIMMYNDIGSYQQLVNDAAMEEALTYAEREVWNHKKIIVAFPWYAVNLDTGAEGPSVPTATGLGRNGSWEQTFTSPYRGVQIDAEALRHKILVVLRKHDVGGFAAWEPGAALTQVWDVLRGRIGAEGASITAAPGDECSGYAFVTNEVIPTGATDRQYNWFHTFDGCCSNGWPLPWWDATGNPGTGLDAWNVVRVSGVVGQRVYEAQSPTIGLGCP